jgi:hypothetical protein
MPDNPQEKILAVRISGDASVVRSFLGKFPTETYAQKREGDSVSFDVFMPEAVVERVKIKGLKLEVLYDASARGRERQKEVGRGNRFEGDRKIPDGLGGKTGGRPQ